ncbi:MAG TPA: PASTA domain-containing protein, partial [Methylomirabilota bacterium]
PPVVTAAGPEPADGPPVMPRLAGLSLRQAMEALAPLGVTLEIAGRGVVMAQSPLPGAPLPTGAPCRLQLAPPAGRTVTAVPASFRP